jgi:hypothetical protein
MTQYPSERLLLIRQQEAPFDRDELGRGLNQGCRRELPRTVHLDLHVVGIPELPDDEVEVAIAGRQHGHVDLLCELDHVEGDAHVPVTLRGAIASLNEGLELHLEADGLEDLLEPDLLPVPAIDSVGEGPDDLSSRGDLIPERLVVEMTSVALLHRVVDVLHVHEDRDSIHGVTCLARTKVTQLRTTRPVTIISRLTSLGRVLRIRQKKADEIRQLRCLFELSRRSDRPHVLRSWPFRPLPLSE